MQNPKFLETPSADLASKIIVRGIHLELSPALHARALALAERLLRHNEHVIRVRYDLEHDKAHAPAGEFIAKGHVEIGGPDLIASVTSEDAYKSLELLTDKLNELLRRRHGKRKDERNHPHATELDVALPKVGE